MILYGYVPELALRLLEHTDENQNMPHSKRCQCTYNLSFSSLCFVIILTIASLTVAMLHSAPMYVYVDPPLRICAMLKHDCSSRQRSLWKIEPKVPRRVGKWGQTPALIPTDHMIACARKSLVLQQLLCMSLKDVDFSGFPRCFPVPTMNLMTQLQWW